MSTSERNVGTSSRLALSGRARHVSFGDDTLIVDLEDGRQMAAPLAWFPRLGAAGPEARSHWELVGRGIGISWPDIDEDISVENLLGADGELLLAHVGPTDRPARPGTGSAVHVTGQGAGVREVKQPEPDVDDSDEPTPYVATSTVGVLKQKEPAIFTEVREFLDNREALLARESGESRARRAGAAARRKQLDAQFRSIAVRARELQKVLDSIDPAKLPSQAAADLATLRYRVEALASLSGGLSDR